jgi:hypothetical protein
MRRLLSFQPFRLGSCLVLVLAACGKSASSTPEGLDTSGGTPGKAEAGTGSAGSPSGGAPSGASPEGGSAASDGGVESAGGAGAQASAGATLDDEPSKQIVTFRVTNGAGALRTVVTEGVGCTELMILAAEPVAVVWTAAAQPCGPCAQCPNPPSGSKRVAELAAGQSVELTWDARRVVAVRETAICSGVGAPYTRFVAAPVAPGAYRVGLSVFAATPKACAANGICDPVVQTTQTALPDAELCSADMRVEADFELPAEGDVTVQLTIQ